MRIEASADDAGRCHMKISDGVSLAPFWIDFSAVDLEPRLRAHYATEIVCAWYLGKKARAGCHAVTFELSHEARLPILRIWGIVLGIRVDIAEGANSFPDTGRRSQVPSSTCISWGGGKDSISSLHMIKSFTSPPGIVLFDLTTHRNGRQIERRIKRRQDLTLSPVAAQYGASVFLISSNAPTAFPLPAGLSYLACIPMLIDLLGIRYFYLNFEAMFFYDASGDFRFRIGPSQNWDILRPLAAKFISSEMSRVFGSDFEIINGTYHLTEYSSFSMAATLAPGGLEHMMMCENSFKDKWCLSCTKCSQLVLYSLAQKIDQGEIPIEKFFAESAWVDRAITNASENGGIWYKGLTYPGHIDSFRYMLSQIGEEQKQGLSVEAKRKLDLLIGAYSDDRIEKEDGVFIKNLFVQWPENTARLMVPFLEKNFAVYDTPSFQKHWGNEVVYRVEEKQALERALQLMRASRE